MNKDTLYVHDVVVASGVDRETVEKVLEAVEHVESPTVTGRFWERLRRGPGLKGRGTGRPSSRHKGDTLPGFD